MKKIIILCVIIFAFIKSVGYIDRKINEQNRMQFVTDSLARVSDSLKIQEMFIADSLEHLDAVKSIKGLGQLHIGDTYTQVKYNFDKDYWNNSKMFRCGNWEHKSSFSRDVDSEIAISKYIHKNITNSNIKEYTTWHYKIGDIEIGRVSCAFYKNKLVAISFNGNDEILDHYIKKYGNGCYCFPDGEYDSLLRYAERTWSNENVTLKYYGFGDDVLIISNDGGFDKYLEELKTYEEMYKDEMKTNHISALNQL